MQSGKRRWIPDAETFNAMGLDWSNIKYLPIEDVDTVPPGEELPSRKDGSLLSINTGGKVYQMQSGKRRWIPDAETFNAMGLDWSNIKYLPIEDVNIVPSGEDLPSRKDDGSTNNRKPVITFPDFQMAYGTSFSLQTYANELQISDPDGDSIQFYEISVDPSRVGMEAWTLEGQPLGKFLIPADQFNSIKFYGSVLGSNPVVIRAFDGKEWSDPKSFNLTVVPSSNTGGVAITPGNGGSPSTTSPSPTPEKPISGKGVTIRTGAIGLQGLIDSLNSSVKDGSASASDREKLALAVWTLQTIQEFEQDHTGPTIDHSGNYTGAAYTVLNGVDPVVQSNKLSLIFQSMGKSILADASTSYHSSGGYLDLYHGIKNENRTTRPDYYHVGIDLDANIGDRVLSLSNGEVVYVASAQMKAGNLSSDGAVAIYNSTLQKTFIYLHMKESKVSVGDSVSAGMQIGLASNLGLGEGDAHVHLEVIDSPSKPNLQGKTPTQYLNSWLTSGDLKGLAWYYSINRDDAKKNTVNPMSAFLEAKFYGMTSNQAVGSSLDFGNLVVTAKYNENSKIVTLSVS